MPDSEEKHSEDKYSEEKHSEEKCNCVHKYIAMSATKLLMAASPLSGGNTSDCATSYTLPYIVSHKCSLALSFLF